MAVSPKMKMLGVKNRCRLYEIPKNIKYIIAKPRMKKYIEYSSNIYAIYLKYISKDDIHVYSIDEAFLDVTNYLPFYKMKSIELVKIIMKDIYDTYGITATAGIGTNLYLAKIALDIMSKHSITNIGWLTEERYREKLWHHKPLSDFWQIGRGIERRLNKMGIYDMYDLSEVDEKRLYKEFGINAEFLIDHSKGIETCTIKDIKNYKPKSTSISSSQVLFEDYNYEKAKLILKEMVELKSIELVSQRLTTDCINLYIGYSKDEINATGGTLKLETRTNVYSELIKAFMNLYERTTNRYVKIRRIGISFQRIGTENCKQLSLFVDENKIEKEENIEIAINELRCKFGLNSVLKGMNYIEGATTFARNNMIGGHNAI